MHPSLAIDADAPHTVLATIDSTSLEAQRRADAGAAGPAWIEALDQTGGRGRRGRLWTSVPGNLYLTYLSRGASAPAETALWGFVAALAAADMAQAHLGPGRARVKWPNDGLIDAAKWCGVLVESGQARNGGAPWRTLGVGLNLAGAPAGTPYAATSLRDVGVMLPREAASRALRQGLADWSRRLVQEGFGPLRARWEALAHGLGGPVRAEIGHERVEGLALGLTDDGALRVGLADGSERLISAGEVFFAVDAPA